MGHCEHCSAVGIQQEVRNLRSQPLGAAVGRRALARPCRRCSAQLATRCSKRSHLPLHACRQRRSYSSAALATSSEDLGTAAEAAARRLGRRRHATATARVPMLACWRSAARKLVICQRRLADGAQQGRRRLLPHAVTCCRCHGRVCLLGLLLPGLLLLGLVPREGRELGDGVEDVGHAACSSRRVRVQASGMPASKRHETPTASRHGRRHGRRPAFPAQASSSASQPPTWVVSLHSSNEGSGQAVEILLVHCRRCRCRPQGVTAAFTAAALATSACVCQWQAPVGGHQCQLARRHLPQRKKHLG